MRSSAKRTVSTPPERPKPTRLEILGAWLRVWTPPRGVEVPPVPWRKVALGALGFVLVASAAAAAIIPRVDDAKSRGDARRAAEWRELVRADTIRRRRDQRLHVLRTEARGDALVGALRSAITADARKRVAAGKLEGPILRTDCEPAAANVSIEPGTRVYKCLAATSRYFKGTSRYGYRGRAGYPFIATVDFSRGTLAWCKMNPQPGEKYVRGIAHVRLSPRCAGKLAKIL